MIIILNGDQENNKFYRKKMQQMDKYQNKQEITEKVVSRT